MNDSVFVIVVADQNSESSSDNEDSKDNLYSPRNIKKSSSMENLATTEIKMEAEDEDSPSDQKDSRTVDLDFVRCILGGISKFNRQQKKLFKLKVLNLIQQIQEGKTVRRSRLRGPASADQNGKLFSCDECDYATRHYYILTRHKRTHTNERPYACDQCNYACGRMDNLRKHRMTHTGTKPYSCFLCEYTCIDSSNMKKHILSHYDNYSSCPSCDYKCKSAKQLAKHKLLHIT